MSDALEHIRYSCGIAGEEVANYVDQLQAKIAEFEVGVERLSAAHVKACQANADSQAELAAAQEEIEQLKATPPDKREDLRCVISDLCRQVQERDAKLAAAQEECEFQRNAHKQAEELMLEQGNQLAAAQLNNKRLRDTANECRLDLLIQVHELADHIERANYCISDPDMQKQINGQREYALEVSSKWNQNGNPFLSLPSNTTTT